MKIYSIIHVYFIPSREVCIIFFFKNKGKIFEIFYSCLIVLQKKI